MNFYQPDYLEFTRCNTVNNWYNGYDVCYFFNNDDIQEYIKSENKLFRVTTNQVYYQKFYGEMLYKITGLNFLNYVGCQ